MSDEIRLQRLKYEYKEYYKNYSLLVTLGLIWLGATSLHVFELHLSILALFLGIAFFRPILFLTTKILGTSSIHKEESLKLLTKSILIGILFGQIIGFFPFQENLNYFFPTYSVIFGFIFLTISICTGLRMYGIVAVVLLTGGIYIGFYYPEDFTLGGYYGAAVMTGIGLLNGLFGKKARITFRYLKKKVKFQPLVIGSDAPALRIPQREKVGKVIS